VLIDAGFLFYVLYGFEDFNFDLRKVRLVVVSQENALRNSSLKHVYNFLGNPLLTQSRSIQFSKANKPNWKTPMFQSRNHSRIFNDRLNLQNMVKHASGNK